MTIGELPLVVNTQSFSGGSHSVSIIASDESGFTAEDTVEYILQNDTRTFCKFIVYTTYQCVYGDSEPLDNITQLCTGNSLLASTDTNQ